MLGVYFFILYSMKNVCTLGKFTTLVSFLMLALIFPSTWQIAKFRPNPYPKWCIEGSPGFRFTDLLVGLFTTYAILSFLADKAWINLGLVKRLPGDL